MSLYLSEKGYITHLLNKHFGAVMTKRFMVRMDSEVFKASEDETIFDRKRSSTEHLHIYFDFIELLDIPPYVPQNLFEWMILKRMRDAIQSGEISIEKVHEPMDLETVKKRKREKEVKKKQKLVDAFKYARDNKFNIQQIEAKLPPVGGATKELSVPILRLGGEN